jgi:flagellar hook assembly protein FlgD
MKRILLALATIFSVGAANAQLASGSMAPDFTGTDLDGNTHTLYDYLQQGFTVVVDVSATWCGPCWNYHNSGALETLWEEHGIENGGTVVVLFVEGDGATTNADLNGTGANTQGNWVSGTGYPIIDDASIGDILQAAYFPTIYTICPNGIVTETGQISAAQHWTFIQNNACQTVPTTDPSFLSYDGTTITCDEVEVAVKMLHIGTEPLTSATITVAGTTPPITYNWTGNLGNFEAADVMVGTTTISSGSEMVITVEGNNDGNMSNNELNPSVAVGAPSTTQVVVEMTTDEYPNEVTWEITNENGNVVASGGPYGDPTDTNGQNPVDVYETHFLPSTGCYALTMIDLYGDGMQGSQWGGTDGYAKAYGIQNGTYMTSFLDYDGSSNYITLTAAANVSETVGVEEMTSTSSFGVYPNPATSITNVNYTLASEAVVTIEVINMLGERVVSMNKGTQQAGTYNNQIDFSNLNAGIYMVNFNVDGVVSTTRLTVAK